MKDVAVQAGVSLSTVSYVLSGSRPISEATRNLILKTMEQLDYQPNFAARALASKRTRVIALLLSPRGRGLSLSELEFVKGASEAARTLGYHLVLLTEGMDSEADLLHLARHGLVDGVLLMEVSLRDPRVPFLQGLGLPFSLLGRPDPAAGLPFVDIDFEGTFEPILDHLADLGHHRLAFVNQGRETFEAGYGPAVRAHEAWTRGAATRGLEAPARFCGTNPRAGWDAAASLLDRDQPPTALVVMNDRAVPGILQALAVRGVRVPEDLSLVAAVSSAATAELSVPALTSADAPGHDLARMAVANLVKTIEVPGAALDSTLIPCPLVIRESTGPVKGEFSRRDR